MLEQLIIAGEATYSAQGQTIGGLKRVNYLFGTNGSGKTTISRVIAKPDQHPTSTVTWTNGRPLEALVYNCDFAAANFSSEMAGIFTLGETSRETLDAIEAKRAAIAALIHDIDNLNNTLGPPDASSGKRSELKQLRSDFERDCWDKIKTVHDAEFHPAFAGLRSSKSQFCDRVLHEIANNRATLKALADLQKRGETVFAKGLERLPHYLAIEAAELIGLEETPVLLKKVVGKDDIDVATLIKRLGNSDWVRHGLKWIGDEDGQCPFCQQDITADLHRKLNNYFDETYVADIAAIGTACTSYDVHSNALLVTLRAVIGNGDKFIDQDAFKADLDRLAAAVEVNKRLLQQKAKEPSSPVNLQPLAALVLASVAHVQAANEKIHAHNALIDNLASEQASLKDEIWKCVIEESRHFIEEYTGKKTGLDRAVESITGNIGIKNGEATTLRAELRDLERQITSVQPTVDAINRTLGSFGFTSFRLATTGENGSRYKIIRGDGADAARTLSEGERSFITFLYFYHLVRGSITESGSTNDRIIIFDDPVSSLDSDVLFIVSTLIKGLVKEAHAGTGRVKQVFVFTHNIYFHKEVSFDPDRHGPIRRTETFWIVRKAGAHTEVKAFQENPIRTSYELLWGEVKRDDRSNLTIANTLRRIIESYFKILGNVDKDDILAKFDGRDQQIASSLFSWVNDGSHGVHDDLYISVDDQMVERYLRVFREVFIRTEHLAHYNMMMGVVPGEDEAAPVAPVAEALAAPAVPPAVGNAA